VLVGGVTPAGVIREMAAIFEYVVIQLIRHYGMVEAGWTRP
jgi:hypothetical protein